MRCVVCSRDAEYIYKGSSVCTGCLVGLTGGFEVKAEKEAERKKCEGCGEQARLYCSKCNKYWCGRCAASLTSCFVCPKCNEELMDLDVFGAGADTEHDVVRKDEVEKPKRKWGHCDG